ncbi:MAG TPA: uridine kinase [Anseongella sp.]
MPSRNNPLIIGICGGSGSGKTYLLELLTTQLEQEVCLLSQDHYYFPLELQQKDERNQVNFDLPSAIDQQRFIRDLDAISLGKEIQLTEYTFNNPARAPRKLRLKPASIIIAEGLFIFHSAAVRKRLDIKVFVEVDEATALERRIKRDLVERAYTEEMIRYQWKHHVKPAYEQYLLPYRDSADLIIQNPPNRAPDLTKLMETVILIQSK